MVARTPLLILAVSAAALLARPYPSPGAPVPAPSHPAKQADDVFGANRDFFPIGPLGLWVLPADSQAGGGLLVRRVDSHSGLRPRLQADDRIVAAAGDSLADAATPRAVLASAIVAAGASEESRELTLTVDRGGETFGATITIRPGAAWATVDPETGELDCERTSRLRAAALRYLDGQQTRDGYFPTDLAATNGKVVVSSIAGLAYLAAGDTTRDGDRTSRLRDLVRWLDRNCGQDPIDRAMRRQQPDVSWNQTNWAHAIAITFLATLESIDNRSRASRTVRSSLADLCRSQTEIGGWGHGPGGVNAQGYVEFSAITAWCSLAVALAERSGQTPSEGVLAAGHAYLRGAIRDGQLGYSHNMRGGGGRYAGVGRTALGLLAFNAATAATDEADRERRAAMAAFVREHIDGLSDSHQGYLLQLLQTALLCRSLGDAAWGEFWAYVQPEIDLAAQADGRFVPRPTPETRMLRANNDIALGDAWATAVYAVILGLRADATCLPLLTTPVPAPDGERMTIATASSLGGGDPSGGC